MKRWCAIPLALRVGLILKILIIGALVAGLVTVSNVARLASDARALVKDVSSNLPAAQIV